MTARGVGSARELSWLVGATIALHPVACARPRTTLGIMILVSYASQKKNQYAVSVCVAKMLFVLAEWLGFILVGPDGSGLDRWGIRAA